MPGVFEPEDVRRLLELAGRAAPKVARAVGRLKRLLPRTMGAVEISVEQLAAGVANEFAVDALERLAQARVELDEGLARALAELELDDRVTRRARPKRAAVAKPKRAAPAAPLAKWPGTIVVRPNPPPPAAPEPPALPARRRRS